MSLHYTLKRCFKYVTGDYIARMDADNVPFPDSIKKKLIFRQK